jgi:hypothetical protein
MRPICRVCGKQTVAVDRCKSCAAKDRLPTPRASDGKFHIPGAGFQVAH